MHLSKNIPKGMIMERLYLFHRQALEAISGFRLLCSPSCPSVLLLEIFHRKLEEKSAMRYTI